MKNIKPAFIKYFDVGMQIRNMTSHIPGEYIAVQWRRTWDTVAVEHGLINYRGF